MAVYVQDSDCQEDTSMPIVEKHPYIDASVKHVGVSKLRGLNADKLRETTDTFVIQENEKPLAVLLTYDKFMAMQEELNAVARTVEMLSDKAELAALKAGMEDTKAKRVRSLDEIDADLKKKK
jgi:PHD/YefM family antitoxin component YafN of YafNO toxin-antitoxin module